MGEAMLDILIRNGRIVDGTGLPAFRGDLAIEGGRLRRVGGKLSGQARHEIDARGQVVAPGFIDPHTHFDAQLMWDGHAKPALAHGITTVVHGNCSLSLAPLKAEHRPKLVSMFQQIEEMPDAAFQGAFQWTWEGFRTSRGVPTSGVSTRCRLRRGRRASRTAGAAAEKSNFPCCTGARRGIRAARRSGRARRKTYAKWCPGS
jgi:hypothetical protein